MTYPQLVKNAALAMIGPFTVAGLRRKLPAKVRLTPWEIEEVLRSMPEIRKVGNDDWTVNLKNVV